MPRIAVALALLLSLPGWAHDADIVFVRAERVGEQVREVVTMTGPTLAALAPIDADRDGLLSEADLAARGAAIEAGVWEAMPLRVGEVRCERGPTSARLRQTFVELSAEFRCPQGSVRQTFELLGVLPENYRVVLGTFGADNPSQAFAQGNERTLVVSAAAEDAQAAVEHRRVSGLGEWIGLGMLHILDVRRALDHLAFLLGVVLLGGGWRRILLLVTAFTLAHSITLGSAALGLIPLGESGTRWVEAAIAFSILYVGAENLWLLRREERAAEGRWYSDQRLYVVFGFGLIHGFGFASVLRDYGLGEQVAKGLFGFNLGVELGQACVVALSFPLVRLLERRPLARLRVVQTLSLLIVAAGGYWLTERLMG